MENIAAVIIQKINGITDEKLAPDDFDRDLKDCMDSLGFVRLIVDLEQEYDTAIPDRFLVLEDINTVRKIEQMVVGLTKG